MSTTPPPSRQDIRYCRLCGAKTVLRIPDDGDTKTRAVCSACHTVHYVNPLNVAGTIPYRLTPKGPAVLLCLRNIEPRKGLWTLPAGFMELGETLEEAAQRETDEEAGAQIQMGPLFTLISVPQVGQVHFFYLASLLSDHFNPGPETQAVRLCHEADLPWDAMAFRTVKTTLRHFFADARAGTFALHGYDIRH